MDPDRDLLVKLDRQENPRVALVATLGAVLAALAGLVTYLTLKLQLNLSGEIAADTAALVFIGSALLLGISFSKSR